MVYVVMYNLKSLHLDQLVLFISSLMMGDIVHFLNVITVYECISVSLCIIKHGVFCTSSEFLVFLLQQISVLSIYENSARQVFHEKMNLVFAQVWRCSSMNLVK